MNTIAFFFRSAIVGISFLSVFACASSETGSSSSGGGDTSSSGNPSNGGSSSGNNSSSGGRQPQVGDRCQTDAQCPSTAICTVYANDTSGGGVCFQKCADAFDCDESNFEKCCKLGGVPAQVCVPNSLAEGASCR